MRGKVLTQGLERCLFLFPLESWNDLAGKLADLDALVSAPDIVTVAERTTRAIGDAAVHALEQALDLWQCLLAGNPADLTLLAGNVGADLAASLLSTLSADLGTLLPTLLPNLIP